MGSRVHVLSFLPFRRFEFICIRFQTFLKRHKIWWRWLKKSSYWSRWGQEEVMCDPILKKSCDAQWFCRVHLLLELALCKCQLPWQWAMHQSRTKWPERVGLAGCFQTTWAVHLERCWWSVLVNMRNMSGDCEAVFIHYLAIACDLANGSALCVYCTKLHHYGTSYYFFQTSPLSASLSVKSL